MPCDRYRQMAAPHNLARGRRITRIRPRMAITRSDRFTLGSVLDRVDTGTFTVSRSTYTAGQFLSAHAHELACATVVMRGAVSERVGGRRFESTQDRFLV